MYFLLDDYTSHGTDIDSFKKEAELFDKHTSIIPVYTCDMHILDYFKISPTKVLFHDIKDDQLTYTENGKYIVTDMMAIRTDSLSEEQMSLIKELRYKSKTLFEFSSSVVKRFFVGETILKTLSSKTNGVGGQFIKNVGSVRNYALLSAIQNETESMNLLYRSDGRLNKAMAVFSKKTVFCARMAVAEAIEALFPKTANIYWKISQQCTEVYVELQNLVCGEFYKGYLFRISDTGFCADTLFTTLRKYDCQPNDYYTLGEISLASDTYDKNGKLTYSGIVNEKGAIRIEELKKRILTSDAYNLQLIEKQRKYFKECKLTTKELSNKIGLTSVMGVKTKIVVMKDINDKGISDPIDFYDYLVSLPKMPILSEYQRTTYRDFLKSIAARAAG